MSDATLIGWNSETGREESEVGKPYWFEKPRSSLPMSAAAYAASIMKDLRRGGVPIPARLGDNGHPTMFVIGEIVEEAMRKAVEVDRERRWWRRLERRITRREWP